MVVYSYHYLLDPKIAEIVSKDLARNTCIVFDEAHNIDNTCIDSMSVKISRRLVDRCLESVTVLESEMARLKAENSAKLQNEYEALVSGLRNSRQQLTDYVSVEYGLGSPIVYQDLSAVM